MTRDARPGVAHEVWMNGVKTKSGFPARRPVRQIRHRVVGLVVFVLAVNGALETWISYRGIKSTLTDRCRKSEATERRIEQSMPTSAADRWVTRASSTR